MAIRALGPLEDPFGALHSVTNTHRLWLTDGLTKMVAHACWATREPDGGFQPERVRVCALPRGAAGGLVPAPWPGPARQALRPGGHGDERHQGGSDGLRLRPASPIAPATARLSSPDDLTEFRKGSERLIEKQVAQLAAAAINVVVVWGKIDKETLTHNDRCGLMVIQVKSRREMVYLSEVFGTPVMPYLLPPLVPRKCQRVYGQELGEGLAVVIEWETPGTPALTMVLREATGEGLRGAE